MEEGLLIFRRVGPELLIHYTFSFHGMMETLDTPA